MRLIIVGSGIVGASCAYTASFLGAQVILVDAAMPGRATAAGAGIICPWSSQVGDPAWYSFACAAAREYPMLIDRLADLGEPYVGYRQVGALALASSVEAREQTRHMLLARRASTPEIGEVQDVSSAEAQRLFPPLRADATAIYISGAARVNGELLAEALVRAAVRLGTVVRDGEARLICRSGRVFGITIGGQLIQGDMIVAATGAWTRSFLQPADLTVQVAAQRGQIMHISLGSVDTSHWPIVLRSNGHYMLAFDDCRIVVGATRETLSGFDYRVTPGGLAEILEQALAVAPGLASGTYVETRVGFRPMGPDVRPLLGPVPGMEGLVVATGLGAFGLTIGPYAGVVAAQVALGLLPAIDLAPFDPLRSLTSDGPSAL